MKKTSLILLITYCIFLTNSCAVFHKMTEPRLAPAIDFKNSSPDGNLIKNIEVTWNNYHLLKISGPINSCGGGGSQIHYIKNLFGPVHAEWENAKGEKLSKDFVFKKSDLSRDPYYSASIILYFTQSDLEYYTSDNPNIKKIQREKSGNWVNKWFEKEGVRKCVNDPKEVKRLRDLDKKYPNISTVTGKTVNEE